MTTAKRAFLRKYVTVRNQFICCSELIDKCIQEGTLR